MTVERSAAAWPPSSSDALTAHAEPPHRRAALAPRDRLYHSEEHGPSDPGRSRNCARLSHKPMLSARPPLEDDAALGDRTDQAVISLWTGFTSGSTSGGPASPATSRIAGSSFFSRNR